MKRDNLRASIDATTWTPWTNEFLAIVDGVRTIATSGDEETIKRLRLAEYAVRARRLLDEAGCQTSLPGTYGQAIEVLRSPADADPVKVGEAIERLASLAALLGTDDRDRGGVRVRVSNRTLAGQDVLPGFEATPTNEGATDE